MVGHIMTIYSKYFRYPPFSSSNDNKSKTNSVFPHLVWPQINAACGYFGNILIIYNMLIYRGMKSPTFDIELSVHNDVDVAV